jgi:hypothetical protein
MNDNARNKYTMSNDNLATYTGHRTELMCRGMRMEVDAHIYVDTPSK